MTQDESTYLLKALECLQGAASEYLNGRYNNCANRCYYAVFQAAIFALEKAGIRPQGDQWSHSFVPAQFEGELIARRHLYPSELRDFIERNRTLRQAAAYGEDMMFRVQADRALRRARTFVTTIQGGELRQ